MFQFLIGTVKTVYTVIADPIVGMFQFLIGTVKTKIEDFFDVQTESFNSS